MRWARLLLVIAFAALTFGGSFECNGSSSGDDDDDGQVRIST